MATESETCMQNASSATPSGAHTAPDDPRPVLVVDDSRTVLLFTQRALEQAGIPTLAVGTAAEAMEAISARQPMLILLDLSVAEHDAGALLQWLTRNNIFQQMRVVLFSNRVDTVLQATAMRLGASGYLRKTGNAREIVAAVSAQLSQLAGER